MSEEIIEELNKDAKDDAVRNDSASDEPVESGTEGEVVQDEAVKELTTEEKLGLAEQKAAEYLDGWQRTQAEFANARKRLERQQAVAYSNATVDHATKMLPILDDFNRAFTNAPEVITEDSWFEGLELVHRKLAAILEGLNVETIEAIGQQFDPRYHEALASKDVEGVESGIVVEEMQAGYRLDDRVIRPSLVIVAS